MQPGAALLNSDLCAVQPLLQRLSVGLKLRHLGLQALGMGHLSSLDKDLWKLTDYFFWSKKKIYIYIQYMAHNKADGLYSLACSHLFRRHFSFVLLLIRNCETSSDHISSTSFIFVFFFVLSVFHWAAGRRHFLPLTCLVIGC